jgi:peptidoglycan/LPS O-acetylase OafA/YrhL
MERTRPGRLRVGSLAARPRRVSAASRTASGHGFRSDIEGLRALAVLLVVLYHTDVGAFAGGYVGVDVFLVVSGFLITGLLWTELQQNAGLSLVAFYARRARRLLPAAVLVLVATLLVSLAWLSPLQLQEVAEDALAAAFYVANYRFAMLETDYLASQLPPSPLQHYWSLAVEEQFYLVWPLLLLASLGLRRSRRVSVFGPAIMVVLVGLASFALAMRLTVVSQPWAFFSLPTRAWELAAGAAAALAADRLRRLPPLPAGALGWAGLTVIVWSATNFSEATAFPGTAALLPVGGTLSVVIAGCAAPRFGPGRVLGLGPLQAIGKLSYSWYLWHWPVLVLAAGVTGRELLPWQNLLLAIGAGALAAVTFAVVENPVRRSPRLVPRPRHSLALGAVLTMVAALTPAVISHALPSSRGTGPSVAAPPDLVTAAAPDPGGAAETTGPTATTQRPPPPRRALDNVVDALSASVHVSDVPPNLDPSLTNARTDKPRVYTEGCHLPFAATRSGDCSYGNPSSSTAVVLFGDSHAAQWFPALERSADVLGWRLVSLTKSTCPPVMVPLWHPSLKRHYRECDAWRDAVVERTREEGADMVVISMARHYDEAWSIQVYSPEWLSGLREIVSRLRATGAAVVVLGPTPHAGRDVPVCLSEHLNDAHFCAQPVAAAVDAAGAAREQDAVVSVGGLYIEPTPWVCTSQTCATIVGNLLVYRDDNHLTTQYVSWLAPVFGEELKRALERNGP